MFGEYTLIITFIGQQKYDLLELAYSLQHIQTQRGPDSALTAYQNHPPTPRCPQSMGNRIPGVHGG